MIRLSGSHRQDRNKGALFFNIQQFSNENHYANYDKGVKHNEAYIWAQNSVPCNNTDLFGDNQPPLLLNISCKYPYPRWQRPYRCYDLGNKMTSSIIRDLTDNNDNNPKWNNRKKQKKYHSKPQTKKPINSIESIRPKQAQVGEKRSKVSSRNRLPRMNH